MGSKLKAIKSFLLSKSTLAHPESIPGTLKHLLVLRLLIVVLWLSITFFTETASIYDIAIIFVVTVALSVANYLLKHSTRTACYSQFVVDIGLISALIIATNGVVGAIPYFLVIIAAAVTLGSHGAVVVAAISALCFSLIVGTFSSSINSMDVVTNVLILTTGALAIGFLSSKFEQLNDFARQQTKNILSLSRQRKEILENVPDGVITLNLESAITGINKAAGTILGLSSLSEDDIIGLRIDEFLRARGVEQPERVLLATKSNSSGSLSLNLDEEQIVALNYKISALSSEDGGKLLVLKDVSRIREMEQALNVHEQLQDYPELEELSSEISTVNMIGDSSAIRSIRSLVAKVAKSDASVLIMGESGTGKELIARLTHELSPRKEGPFVAINCGAIPENLIESQLFGHKKGSFTGADKDHTGLLAQADGGTVFLDEVGELPLTMQTKLLRVLQEKTVRPVGGNSDININVRVLSATNRNLKSEVEDKNFREDLYYRLNVISIYAPPLRERREDIPLLVNYFIREHRGAQLSPEALRLLMKYRYPGNIRELQNIVERALVLGENRILASHLPEEVRNYQETVAEAPGAQLRPTFPIDLEGELENIEKTWISLALEEAEGVKTRAAELLGLNFRSFRYRLKKYELDGR